MNIGWHVEFISETIKSLKILFFLCLPVSWDNWYEMWFNTSCILISVSDLGTLVSAKDKVTHCTGAG